MNITGKIDILTRVEGHGSVELIRDAIGKVVDARVKLHESPRLFEALLPGRGFDEIPDIACRICSICSTAHKVAALEAVEQAMGITVSRQTSLLRELAVQGGQIESHALHIFCLSLPDYLGVNNISELAKVAPKMFQNGLRIKKLGNLIQETIGGRAIHPFNLLVGGVGRMPEIDSLKKLRLQVARIEDEMTSNIKGILSLDNILPPLEMLPVCAVSGSSSLFGDRLITSTGETIPASSVIEWLNERVEADSYAKVSGFDGSDPFMVGPLARLTLAMPHIYADLFTDISIRLSLKARIIELYQAIMRAEELIKELLANGLKNETPMKITTREGEGICILEAPRGLLLHSYRFNYSGICTMANIITPTAINQGAMAFSLKALIAKMDGADYHQIKTAAETLIRCYDPCISCAVH